ncbi:hypothetical protein [Pedobacter frigoris]|uniref:hypothetical protein n=1 Tax=Pedobacter frigoris TaxID=2571272 RepID=UPI00292DDDB1|nr:hypothetical protein [Pedobacter frigoris]
MAVGFACVIGAGVVHKHRFHRTVAHHHHADKDNCCKDEVTKLLKADKVSVASVIVINPPAFIKLYASYYQSDVLVSFERSSCTKYFVRDYHPPIPDIRVSIQSFQI